MRIDFESARCRINSLMQYFAQYDGKFTEDGLYDTCRAIQRTLNTLESEMKVLEKYRAVESRR